MARIVVAQVLMTEQDVKELMKAIEEGKEKNLERIAVKSEYSNVRFLIAMELEPHTQESIGYHIAGGS